MLNENILQIIRDTLAALREPVRLSLFVSDGECRGCMDALETAKAIKEAFSRISLATYDIVMDRDQTELYGIKRVPSFVVQARSGRGIIFSGLPMGVSLVLLLDTIAAVSRNDRWHAGSVASGLQRLERDVHVQLFLDHACALCRPVGITAIGCSLESPHVITEVITADAFPELCAKLNITLLPTLVLGARTRADGHIDAGSFLELLFRAEGQTAAGQDRSCVVCGRPAGDVVCGDCKTRIQGEAVHLKRTAENLHQHGTVVNPRRNV